ncbi:MAG: hypothetical protein HY268_12080 [Deltaproteobacteria bacterium]|nr:hypothetical protein [Deltaproteobacteria bacterium]
MAKSGVRSPEFKGQDPQPRRLGTAHRAWVVVAVAGLVLVTALSVAVRYLSLPIPGGSVRCAHVFPIFVRIAHATAFRLGCMSV